MKRFILVSILLGLVEIGSPSFGLPPKLKLQDRFKGDVFHVSTFSPPAAILVIGPGGVRLGADPSHELSDFGTGIEINEFPTAEIEQMNIGNDDARDPPKPSQATSWFLRVDDAPPHIYIVQLRGLQFGISEVLTNLTLRPSAPELAFVPVKRTNVLVAPGLMKELVITTDREARRISVARVVQPSDLKQSVELSCTLLLISPVGVCVSLNAKAKAVAAAGVRGNRRALEGPVHAFLKELVAQGAVHVKEPALTILREEATALLDPQPPVAKPRPIVRGKVTKANE